MLNVGDDIINTIIENRPYASMKDFLYKTKTPKQAMVSLIKGGAFDELEPDRKFAMAWYLWETCDKKERLTLQNMPGLIKYNMLPKDTNERITAKRVYEFNRYLKAFCKFTSTDYKLDERALNFIYEMELYNLLNGSFLNIKKWDKVYQSWMDVFRNWIAENKEQILNELNSKIFKEDWDKYAKQGNISSWEMEVLCFYYHEHELAKVNCFKYGFADFNKLPEDPIVEREFGRGGKILKLNKIFGTCIAKNKSKSTVTLLTTTGVVEVKFRKEYFSLFDKRISERYEDGTKHIVEKSWFDRGSMIVVTGFRSGDNFIAKKYSTTPGHQLYKIDKITEDNNLVLRFNRYHGEEEEDE